MILLLQLQLISHPAFGSVCCVYRFVQHPYRDRNIISFEAACIKGLGQKGHICAHYRIVGNDDADCTEKMDMLFCRRANMPSEILFCGTYKFFVASCSIYSLELQCCAEKRNSLLLPNLILLLLEVRLRWGMQDVGVWIMYLSVRTHTHTHTHTLTHTHTHRYTHTP